MINHLISSWLNCYWKHQEDDSFIQAALFVSVHSIFYRLCTSFYSYTTRDFTYQLVIAMSK